MFSLICRREPLLPLMPCRCTAHAVSIQQPFASPCATNHSFRCTLFSCQYTFCFLGLSAWIYIKIWPTKEASVEQRTAIKTLYSSCFFVLFIFLIGLIWCWEDRKMRHETGDMGKSATSVSLQVPFSRLFFFFRVAFGVAFVLHTLRDTHLMPCININSSMADAYL